jgi:pyruvate dehydrogenase E2 component (dihydrolipoamide acetyltransferase)
MAVEMILPKVDMDQETGTIVEWLKGEGEQVKKGEIILVIETNKVTMEIEAPASGILGGIRAQPGEVLPIATVIAYILAPGEELPAGEPERERSPEGKTETKGATIPPGLSVGITPVARNMALAAGLDPSTVVGTGPSGKITKRDIAQTIEMQGDGDSRSAKIYATPKAKRIAGEQGIDLATITGSGPENRVQASDVLNFAATVGGDVEEIPLQGMRRTIAVRMTESYQTKPHITFTARVDMTGFEGERAHLNSRAEAAGGVRVSVTALMVKLVAWTLRKHPMFNSTLQDDTILLRKDINIGVAVALPDGLIVPVVRQADRKNLEQISGEVDDLVQRARQGELTPGDVSGGSFSISNLGPFGIEQFTAIINADQAAILAVGATQPEVVPIDGQPAIRPILRLTLSADHRIVDGAMAAHFLAEIKEVFEEPTLALW